MLRKLIKNKKAQNTAEYAILISLVVAGIVAMQTYAQRALQARVRDAATFLKNETKALGTSTQYEPYYLSSSYTTTRNATETELLDDKTTAKRDLDTRTRASGGFQNTAYNAAIFKETF